MVSCAPAASAKVAHRQMNQPETSSAPKTHLDIYDPDELKAVARDLEVTEDELKQAVRMFGSRITTVRAHLDK